jgi:hypothetical protein
VPLKLTSDSSTLAHQLQHQQQQSTTINKNKNKNNKSTTLVSTDQNEGRNSVQPTDNHNRLSISYPGTSRTILTTYKHKRDSSDQIQLLTFLNSFTAIYSVHIPLSTHFPPLLSLSLARQEPPPKFAPCSVACVLPVPLDKPIYFFWGPQEFSFFSPAVNPHTASTLFGLTYLVCKPRIPATASTTQKKGRTKVTRTDTHFATL